ncbi:MAG: AmmeMemoRadiSam system radical SAM enzyme [Clostridiales bacterium]|jgi:pyruvate formate lyase activating enzyme|nr:AmmeMemoRadiSam system radical SAM enzyme [Clostridiales bacterium]
MDENAGMVKAQYWHQTEDGKCKCELCPHACEMPNGSSGLCGVRKNINGQLYATSYGEISAAALDPIEKKPLRLYKPGSKILSIGSYGCNMKCPFCQNHDISMTKPETQHVTAKTIAKTAAAMAPKGNIGLAYTYNEPLVSFEYVYECAKEVKSLGMDNILVTNGSVSPDAFASLIELIDAANIDLKGGSDFYRMAGGSHELVRENIRRSAGKCHVEVTWLAIPGENDSDQEMDEAASFLASIDKAIPLHITRFFPKHKWADREETSRETVLRLVDVAERRLENVFAGNMR